MIEGHVFDITLVLGYLMAVLSKFVEWSQTHFVQIGVYNISFFYLAIGGFVIYIILSKLPIWDEFPEPYHSAFEDEEGFDD